MKTVNKKNIAVMFGGESPEHEVSVITGVQILNNIDHSLYNVVPVYISKTGHWYSHDSFFEIETFKDIDTIPYFADEVFAQTNNPKSLFIKKGFILKTTKNVRVDAIFPCMHGDIGEGGGIQGLCEVLEIPYVGSNILGSALGLDKIKTRQLLRDSGMEIINYIEVSKRDWIAEPDLVLKNITQSLIYPIIVKPACCGSSIGITVVKETNELSNALNVAFTFDNRLIVERYLENHREINIAVMGGVGEAPTTSVCEEVFHTNTLLSFNDKYKGEEGSSKGMASANRKIPAEIDEKTYENISEKAKQIFTTLSLSGTARLDFLLDNSSKTFTLIEANTIPGSMAFYLWNAAGIKFKDLITSLINIAESEYQKRKSLTKTFPNNLLKDFKQNLKSPKLVGAH